MANHFIGNYDGGGEYYGKVCEIQDKVLAHKKLKVKSVKVVGLWKN